MANRKDDVTVTIGGDASGADKALKATSKQLGSFVNDTRKSFGGLGGQLFSLRGALAGLAGGFSLKAIIDSSVEAERRAALLDAKLRSTGRTAEFSSAQLLDMAGALQKVTTFGDEELSGVLTTLLSFGRISGQTFEDAAKAVVDYSASTGKSLEEAADTVGRALQQPDKAAKQLRAANILLTDSETKKLKAMVESGRVADAQAVVLGKLQKAYGGAAADAANTFGGALQQLKNAAGDLLEGSGGNLNDAKVAVQDLTKVLQSEETKQGFATITGAVITLVGWLAKGIVKFTEFGKAIGEGAARLFTGAQGNIDDQIDRLRTQLESYRKAAGPTPSDAMRAEIARVEDELGQAYKRLHQLTGKLGPTLKPDAGKGKPGAGVKPGGDGGADEDLETDADRKKAADAARKRAQAVAAAEAAVFKAQQERQRASLDALNEQNLISVREYHARKLELELAAIDQELAARRKAMATADADEKIRLQGEIEALGTQRTAAVEASAREQAKAEKQLADERLELEERLLEATGRTAEARAAAIEREFGELIKKLKAQGDDAGVAIAVELKGVELARSQFDELERQLDEAQAAYQRRLKEIDTAVTTGARTRSQGRRDQVAAAEELVAVEERIADSMEAQAAIIKDPAVFERVKALRQEILVTGTVVDEALNQVRGAFEDGFTGLFEDLQRKPGDVADAVENMVASINASIQRIIAQRLGEQLADSLFGSLLNGGSGGSFGDGALGGLFSKGLGALSGLFGGTSSTGVKELHAGGLAGTGRTRHVPAITFADAPRYHRGGLAGLGPDEVPAILKAGRDVEEVIRRDDPRHRLNGGLMPMAVNVNIAAPDPQALRTSRQQIEASIGSAVQRALRRNR